MIKKNEKCAFIKKQLNTFFLLWNRAIITLILLALMNSSLTASPEFQQRIITGKISDSNGNPLPGVNIVVKGTTIGLASGTDGKFSISVPSSSSVLSFSFIGYFPTEITVGNQTVINVILGENIRDLGEIVVV